MFLEIFYSELASTKKENLWALLIISGHSSDVGENAPLIKTTDSYLGVASAEFKAVLVSRFVKVQ